MRSSSSEERGLRSYRRLRGSETFSPKPSRSTFQSTQPVHPQLTHKGRAIPSSTAQPSQPPATHTCSSPSMNEQPSCGSSLAVVPGSSVEKMAPKSPLTLRHVFSRASRFFSSNAPIVCRVHRGEDAVHRLTWCWKVGEMWEGSWRAIERAVARLLKVCRSADWCI